jgi:actin
MMKLIAERGRDYEAELAKAGWSSEIDLSYELPDGNVVYVRDERCRCPELLLKPHLDGIEDDVIDTKLNDSIMMCDPEIREDFYANIILAGGSSMFPGIAERIDKKVTDLAPPTMKIKVVAPDERKYAAWVGCSMLLSLATFPQMVILIDEYVEAGTGIVHGKCI